MQHPFIFELEFLWRDSEVKEEMSAECSAPIWNQRLLASRR